jgi:cytidine deaminase
MAQQDSFADPERLEHLRTALSDSGARAPAELVDAAREAQAHSHHPYSGLAVGAALVFDDGSLFSGTNVESASYGLTQCAERVAIGNAVTAGRRRLLLAVITSSAPVVLPPCGACRQVLSEFGPRAVVFSVAPDGSQRRWTMPELLPDGFDGDDLRR